ncbi:hypothetical protein ASPZODRAFT_148142 [Penicilliopsis zonata CBS 506.65]|uniref:Major facilitator superfamily (MFS) profile domain-containing protein n=1 Tax=Penicilliopsis zonata CBS 506.65 TaxID=1073090 RepID=A0A1L9SUA0_9EURO|nr:hypothetical protein ASPZODRAFT_148142 [Penicilliopsis zonata CBS 506.65]OJJ50667.1 hypothetical protein ASPZODRAFT_148142 [Penicilliopsis zonata CBS 506.65]
MAARDEKNDGEMTAMEEREVVVDWEEAEERKLVLKVDLYLLPLLLLAFFFLCLDRTNISNALTDNFTTDLGITTAQATLGNQLQQAGIVIFELPANLVLARVGAHRWLVFLMLAWGCVATFQCFIQNRAQYYATRFLLGAFEGGFIPGAMYLLGQYHPRSAQSTRFAIASGTSALIAAGVLTLDGVRGWSGWRWLFLIDGSMTLAFALILLALLPGAPPDTRPVHGLFSLFDERERHILQSRVQLENPPRMENPSMHFAINFFGVMPAGGLVLFGPTIVKELGFSTSKANALVAVGYYAAVPLALSLGFFASRTRLNGIASLIPFAWSCFFVGLFYHFDITRSSSTSDSGTLYALFTLVLAAMLIGQPVNNAWCSKNATNDLERSAGLALCVISSNLAGLVGQRIFPASDAPEYRPGLVAAICLYVAAILVVLAQMVQYAWCNRRASNALAQWQFVL